MTTKVDKKFTMNIQGNEFIKFEGLLEMFHQNGGKSIHTELISSEEPYMFKATVEGENGTFTGHGDADKTNVNSMIAKHMIRMAETRAIARALRWYNNIGMCSADELGGDDTPVVHTTKTPKKNETTYNPEVHTKVKMPKLETEEFKAKCREFESKGGGYEQGVGFFVPKALLQDKSVIGRDEVEKFIPEEDLPF